MELLTRKAKEQFEKWLKKQPFARYNTYTKKIIIHGKEYSELNESFVQTLNIDWFDSVKIHIGIETKNVDSFRTFIYEMPHTFWMENKFSNRKDALESAIQKANEIYNERF